MCDCNCGYNPGFSGTRCYIRSVPGCAPRSTRRNTYTRSKNQTPIYKNICKCMHLHIFFRSFLLRKNFIALR